MLSRLLRVLLLGALAPAVVAQEKPRLDVNGDPLPAGALARVGTSRLRHDKMVIGLAWSSDGKYIASSGWDNLIRLWDGKTGRAVRTFEGHRAAIYGVAFSPDGKLIASNGSESTIRVWETATGKQLRELSGHNAAHARFIFSHDGKHLFSGGDDSKVHVWDPHQGTLVRSLVGHASKVSAVHLTPDGKTLASGSWDNTVKLWDVASGKELRHIGPLDGHVGGVHFSPDGKLLAVSTYSGTVYLFDAATGKEVRTMRGHRTAWPVVFSPDGKLLASGGVDGLIIVWDPATGEKKHELIGHSQGVARLAFAPDGSALASASHDATVRLWDPRTGRELLPSVRHAGPVNAVALSPDGKLLATAGRERVVRLWEATTGRHLDSLTRHVGPIVALVFLPDGKHLLAASAEGLSLWEARLAKKLRDIKVEGGQVTSVAVAPDGKTLAAVANNHLLRWDADSGEKRSSIELPRGPAQSLAWSPDGRAIAVGSFAGVDILDVPSGRWQKPGGRGPSGCAGTLAFSADSRLLLVRTDSGLLCLVEAATGDMRLRYDGLHGPSKMTQLLLPGGRVASLGPDGLMKVADLRTAELLDEKSGFDRGVLSAAVSVDGDLLATGHDNTTALVWDLRRIGKAKAAPAVTTLRTVEQMWEALGGADAGKAHEAISALAAMPKEALDLLGKNLRPEPGPDAGRIARLIEQLEDRRFNKREDATRELEKLGAAAEPAMKKALEATPSLDARRRLEGVLAQLGYLSLTPEQVRGIRAVETLELIGGKDAFALLDRLAAGPADSRIVREAKGSLARMKGVKP